MGSETLGAVGVLWDGSLQSVLTLTTVLPSLLFCGTLITPFRQAGRPPAVCQASGGRRWQMAMEAGVGHTLDRVPKR